MSSSVYTTLNEVKLYAALNQNTDGSLFAGRDDTIVTDALDAYSRAIDSYCNWQFYTQTATAKIFRIGSTAVIDKDGFAWLKTNSPSISSLAALAYRTSWSQTWIAIDPARAQFETLDELTRPTQQSYQIGIDRNLADWLSQRNNGTLQFRASYVGGYDTLPTVIGRVATEWVYYDYKLREAIPVGTVQFPTMGAIIRPLDVPLHLQALLNPYRRTWL